MSNNTDPYKLNPYTQKQNHKTEKSKSFLPYQKKQRAEKENNRSKATKHTENRSSFWLFP